MPPSQALLTFALKFSGLLYRFQILRLNSPQKGLGYLCV